MISIQTILRLRRWLRRIALVLVGFFVVLGPRLLWHATPVARRGIVIVDKTVPFKAYREHSVFTWLLHNQKLGDRHGDIASERDYLGFEPYTRTGVDFTAADLAFADTVFIADTYGVYELDYAVPGDIAALERSPKIYGGLSLDEMGHLEQLEARGGTIIGEFNSFASPTEDEPRARFEKLVGATWTHWVGRYWENMQDPEEVPKWVGRVYERRYKVPMDIEGPAFVLVREDADIVLLRPGTHIEADVLAITRTKEAPDLTGLPEGTRALYWLDILERTDAEIVYEYSFSLKDEGRALLKEHKIPEHFPAMLRKRAKGTTYYFAGDFIDTKLDLGDPERAGLLRWRSWTRASSSNPSEAFFWGWYAPILKRLLTGG